VRLKTLIYIIYNKLYTKGLLILIIRLINLFIYLIIKYLY